MQSGGWRWITGGLFDIISYLKEEWNGALEVPIGV